MHGRTTRAIQLTARGTNARKQHSVAIGLQTVKQRIINAKSVGIAIALTAAIGGTAAYAYPPGTAMTISKPDRLPAPKHKATYRITVNNVQPGCLVEVSAGNAKETGTAGSGGTVTVTLTFNANGGKRQIKARTVGCDPKETASRFLTVKEAHLEGPASVKRYESFTIKAEHYPPNLAVTFTATKNNRTVVRNATTDKYGQAYVSFWLPEKGAWAIVGAGNGEAHTWWVQVV